MKNAIICKNCSNENPEYLHICTSCRAFIRERVVNIDLWSKLWQIVEYPVIAFTDIIYAEHKNFIFLLAVLSGIKLFLNSALLADPLFQNYNFFSYTVPAFFTSIVILLSLLALLSLLLTHTAKAVNADTRFKDNFSVIIYSLLPHVFSLIILFPIEIVLFGGYLFSSNPSPFLLKENAAYVMAGLEGIFILYSIALTFIAIKTSVKSIFVSAVFSLLLHFTMAAAVLLMAKIFG